MPKTIILHREDLKPFELCVGDIVCIESKSQANILLEKWRDLILDIGDGEKEKRTITHFEILNNRKRYTFEGFYTSRFNDSGFKFKIIRKIP